VFEALAVLNIQVGESIHDDGSVEVDEWMTTDALSFERETDGFVSFFDCLDKIKSNLGQ
jgi:hypothetical protein